MIRKLLLAITIISALAPPFSIGQLNPASENERSLLKKSEILDLMTQVGKVPARQQDEKIEQLWTSDGGSKTPRSDFLYCAGFAYLDRYKAQACLGRAFENGLGIVQDYSDAYAWYAIALEHPIEDTAVRDHIQAGKDRVKMTLLSVYPAPSDFELEELVKNQKEKIALYMKEIRDTGK